MLKGKRTYIVAGLWAAAIFASTVKIIDPSQLDAIQAFLLPVGLATLRAGIGNSS